MVFRLVIETGGISACRGAFCGVFGRHRVGAGFWFPEPFTGGRVREPGQGPTFPTFNLRSEAKKPLSCRHSSDLSYLSYLFKMNLKRNLSHGQRGTGGGAQNFSGAGFVKNVGKVGKVGRTLAAQALLAFRPASDLGPRSEGRQLAPIAVISPNDFFVQ